MLETMKTTPGPVAVMAMPLTAGQGRASPSPGPRRPEADRTIELVGSVHAGSDAHADMVPIRNEPRSGRDALNVASRA